MKINRLVLFVVLICTTFALNAQEQHRIEDKGAVVGVKTNIPYWGTATFNAEVEVRLAKKWTLELEAGLNPFDGKKDDGSYGRSLKHLRLHPELRYWFCESFHKHFLGLHIPYLLYNVSDVKLLGVENERSQGWGTASATDTSGCCRSIGIWKRLSVWDTSIWITTNIPVPTAGPRSKAGTNIISVRRRPLSVSCIYSKRTPL